MISGDLLITGASGFLGSRLTAYFLDSGYSVTALVRENSSLHQLDGVVGRPGCSLALLTPDYANLSNILVEKKFDAVIHVGAASDGGDDIAAVRKLSEGNILFPSLLLAGMKAAGICRLINTGTSWQNITGPEYSPFNLYAATKEAFEKILEHYVLDGLAAVTLRLFDVYGPGDPRSKLVNLLLRISKTDEILDMTAGAQSVDLVHVMDACGAYGAALKILMSGCPTQHLVYNVSGQAALPLRDVVAIFERVRGVRCPINWGARPYRTREVMTPIAPYNAVPGWRPTIGLVEGLAGI